MTASYTEARVLVRSPSFCTAKTKHPEKDIKGSAKVLRKCSASSFIVLWQPKLAGLLYLAWFSRYKHFCVLQFLQKIQNGRHFLAKQKFFENWHGYYSEIPCGSKILLNLLYLAWFSRYKHFCVCNFCEKFENSKWPPNLARQNFLFQIGMASGQRYPVGQKFCQNRSI